MSSVTNLKEVKCPSKSTESLLNIAIQYKVSTLKIRVLLNILFLKKQKVSH